jgi:hypothetical protein
MYYLMLVLFPPRRGLIAAYVDGSVVACGGNRSLSTSSHSCSKLSIYHNREDYIHIDEFVFLLKHFALKTLPFFSRFINNFPFNCVSLSSRFANNFHSHGFSSNYYPFPAYLRTFSSSFPSNCFSFSLSSGLSRIVHLHFRFPSGCFSF